MLQLENDQQGIAIDRIINSTKDQKLIERLACPICLNIIWKPVSCTKCQTLFCDYCITKWTNSNSKCINRCVFQKSKAPPLVFQCLSDLNFICKYFNVGCKEKIGYDQLVKHENNCNYRDQECQGCKKVISKCKFAKHEEACDFIKVSCRGCKNNFSRLKLKSHREFDCVLRSYDATYKEVEKIDKENQLLKQNSDQLSLTIRHLEKENRSQKVYINELKQENQNLKENMKINEEAYKQEKIDLNINSTEFIASKVENINNFVSSLNYPVKRALRIIKEDNFEIEKNNENIDLIPQKTQESKLQFEKFGNIKINLIKDNKDTTHKVRIFEESVQDIIKPLNHLNNTNNNIYEEKE